MDFEQHIYGMTEEGEAVIVYILRAESGAEVHITNFGASIIAVKIPDAEGKLANVVSASGDLPSMLRDRAYVGRTIDWSVGLRSSGVHNSMWESRFEINRVVMSWEAQDNMVVEAIFDFDDDMSLEVTYLAKSDLSTPMDISPNLLFNLLPDELSSVAEHELKITSEGYEEFAPVQEIFSRGSELDMKKSGYKRGILTPMAELRESKSHRRVEILSSKEGVNLYRGDRSKDITITPRSISGEEVAAGELYCEKVVYKFSTY